MSAKGRDLQQDPQFLCGVAVSVYQNSGRCWSHQSPQRCFWQLQALLHVIPSCELVQLATYVQVIPIQIGHGTSSKSRLRWTSNWAHRRETHQVLNLLHSLGSH